MFYIFLGCRPLKVKRIKREKALKHGVLKTVSMEHGHESPAGEDADLYLEPTGLSIWAKCHVLMPFLEISLTLSVK